jgi:hypothetical protein
VRVHDGPPGPFDPGPLPDPVFWAQRACATAGRATQTGPPTKAAERAGAMDAMQVGHGNEHTHTHTHKHHTHTHMHTYAHGHGMQAGLGDTDTGCGTW